MLKQNNNRIFSTQQKILAALCVIVAFIGGCWFMAYHAYVTVPTTETITVTLPETNSRPAEVVEVTQEKPERKWFSALLHPFGFMVLLLMIVGAGAGLILLVVYLDKGVQDGRK